MQCLASRGVCSVRVPAAPAKGLATPRLLRCTVNAAKTDGKKEEVKLQATALPVMALGLADALNGYLQPQADYFSTLGLPEALVHWGHPGNMFVVLAAMGGYGAVYLGWAIRTSDSAELVAKAKDLHPKLAGGMAFFFAAGALGGMMSLLMQHKSILESPHAITGLAGLALLGVQATLPLFFDKGARTAHAYLGSSIMALFLVHAAFGLNLGLSLP